MPSEVAFNRSLKKMEIMPFKNYLVYDLSSQWKRFCWGREPSINVICIFSQPYWFWSHKTHKKVLLCHSISLSNEFVDIFVMLYTQFCFTFKHLLHMNRVTLVTYLSVTFNLNLIFKNVRSSSSTW